MYVTLPDVCKYDLCKALCPISMKLMEGVSRYCGPVICRDVQNRFLTATRKDIKFDVILTLYLSICPGTDISAMVQPIGVKFCMIVEL